MDKPRPEMLLTDGGVASDKALQAVRMHQKLAATSVFALAAMSAEQTRIQVANKNAALANFGFYLKTREMRTVGVRYKVAGADSREARRRFKQLARQQTKPTPTQS